MMDTQVYMEEMSCIVGWTPTLRRTRLRVLCEVDSTLRGIYPRLRGVPPLTDILTEGSIRFTAGSSPFLWINVTSHISARSTTADWVTLFKAERV